MPVLRYYLAGKYESRERLRKVRDKLRALGHEVTSAWLDETVERDAVDDRYRYTAAQRNLVEIKSVDILVLDTLDEDPYGGREAELGYALALHKTVVRVGPVRNIFHTLPFEYPSWEAYLAYLEFLERSLGV